MPSLAHFFSAFARTGAHLTVAIMPIPGLGAVSDLLSNIIDLCERIPQNRNAACHLAWKCHELCRVLEQYEEMPMPDRTLPFQIAVSECLKEVWRVMDEWSKKRWHYILVHQGDFEAEFLKCDAKISDCILTFMAAVHLEMLARQKVDDEWRKNLMESLEADHKAVMEQLAAPNFVQRVTESELTLNDQREISAIIQRGLAERNIVSEEDHIRMAKNLYGLLRLSNQLPTNCQLNPGMVEWTEAPFAGDKRADMYKGRYLQSEDVRIKVIRSVDASDEKNIERVRREVELWSKLHELDQGKHIIPFLGFYTPNGIHLALVSPWIGNGDALAYVKKHDKLLNYRKLILGIAEGIKVLHSMNIIHGNLRAKKILIGDNNQPLITDFALAKLEGNLITQTSGESDNCRWCAPDMFEEQAAVSAKGDIYSFGMTILELLTHDVPYAHIRRNIQVIKRKEREGNEGIPEQPQNADAIERGLDNRMWAVLCVCWSKDPQNRPSIDELVMQL